MIKLSLLTVGAVLLSGCTPTLETLVALEPLIRAFSSVG